MTVPEKIIRQCKKFDEKAQEYIYKKYAPELLSICRRYFKDISKAEDVMQDAFLVIFSKIKQYNGSGSFEGWMKRITLNTALIQLRKDKKEIVSESFEYIESKKENNDKKELNVSDIKSVIENAGFDQFEIIDLMDELPDGFKTVFNLYVIEGMKHKEIAKELNISVGTSKSQLLRARQKLKNILYKKAIEKLKNTKKKIK